jgi:hypothetical protein
VKIENNVLNIYEEPLRLKMDRYGREMWASRQNILLNNFKDFLRVSPRFFELCLKNTPEELKKIFDEIYNLTLEGSVKEHFIPLYKTNPHPPYDDLVAYLQAR